MTTTIALDCEYKQMVRPGRDVYGRPLRPFPGAGELFRRFGCAAPSADILASTGIAWRPEDAARPPRGGGRKA